MPHLGYARSLAVALTLAALIGCSDDGAGTDADTGPVDDVGVDGTAPDADTDTDLGGADGPPPDTPQPDSADDDSAPDSAPDRPPEGDPVTVPVGSVFEAGTAVRDAYNGSRGVVDEQGNVTLIAHGNGVLLVERDEARGGEADFSWDNVTVYFVMTDRFENGNPANDSNFGREPDGDDEIGTFHGGDFAGITQRLDHLEDLGVNALWITPIVEQVHGWVGGGTGDFIHYPYHGYWALDFTRLDPNYGTEDELRELVDEAHARGIRVILDVVINHAGYATMEEMNTYFPDALMADGWETWTPSGSENWHSWNDIFVDFNSSDWVNWWGPPWVRAVELPFYTNPGTNDLTRSLAFLPDFKTESTDVVGLPPMLTEKGDTNAVVIADATVRDYLIEWQVAWVRELGIDGFRCDTAKHVELDAWAALSAAANEALDEWRAANPELALDDSDFWMTGEVFPHGVTKDGYFTVGDFDSLINFDLQFDAFAARNNPEMIDALYAEYAGAINVDPEFNVLSYISSHDTELFFEEHDEDMALQYRIGTILLMTPGGVQIFYGDETARPIGPFGSEPAQGTRSDMNWDDYDQDLLAHWQRLGRFRDNHVAVGAGSHARITFEGGYGFSRSYSAAGIEDDVAVFVLGL